MTQSATPFPRTEQLPLATPIGPGSLSRRLLGWTAAALYVVLLTALFIKLPQVAVPDGLDPSWHALLMHDWLHDLAAGRDFVFTYGPLASLLATDGYRPEMFWLQVITGVITSLLCALSLTAAALRVDRAWLRNANLVLLVLLAPIIADAVFVLTILALATWNARRPSLARLLVVLPVLSLLGMVKFTCFMLAGACVLLMAFAAWWSARRLATMTLLLYPVTFVAAWLAIGQPLSAIAPFVRGSMEISSGYNESMGYAGDPREFVLGAAIGICLLSISLLRALLRRNAADLAVTGLVAAGIVLAWKAGFVRHDSPHAIVFFVVAALAPFLLHVQPSGSRAAGCGLAAATAGAAGGPWRIATALLVTASVVGALSAARGVGYAPADIPATLFNRAAVALQGLASPAALDREQQQQLATQKERYRLPRIREVVGAGTIDNIGHEQGMLVANDLALHHRPVFQTYSAYTPYLQELNGRFYEGPRAPDFVTLQVQPIDGRFAMAEDSQAYKAILRRYAPVLVERGALLLRRRDATDPPQRRILLERRIRLDEWVDVAALGAAHLEVALDVEFSRRGRVLGALTRPAALWLEIRADDGSTTRHRIAPCMVSASFLVSPLVRSLAELLAVYGAGDLVHTLALRLCCEAGDQQSFHDDVGITVATDPTALPPRELTAATRGELMSTVYPMFGVAPTKVVPASNASVRNHGERLVLLSHPPLALYFDLAPDAHRVVGSFGIVDDAWQGANRTDGVTFTVAQASNGTERVLFHRHLDPLHRVEDRGVQTFAVETRAQPGDVVILRTDGGPSRDFNWDWSFWAGFDIE